MSGLAAIVHFDGSRVDARIVQEMTGAVAHRGPDGGREWIKDSVGLGHRILRTTPEDAREHQPLCDESGQVCLTFDGRVDNREELARCLNAEGARLREDTDSELVLKAYLQWGEGAPLRILGDFAFAIWDGRLRALFCARDVFGIRPLNYYWGGNFVLIASELHQLLCDRRVKPVPNEGMVAEFLAGEPRSLEETLWEGILRLPPAHFMWVRAGGLEKRRYWDFDLSREVRYGSDEEYAEHFLELLREAVRCRLRSSGPVAAQLSGGLDSSSVCVMAKELLREQGRAESLETYSLVFPGMSCDESEYIQATAQQAGLRSHCFPPVEVGAGYFREQTRLYRDFPGWPNGGAMTFLPMRDVLGKGGVRVLLTGAGGNQCVEGSSYILSELRSEGKFVELVRVARKEAALWGGAGGDMYWTTGFGRTSPSR